MTDSRLTYFNLVFDQPTISRIKSQGLLANAITRDFDAARKFRKEMNKWLTLAGKKGWLDESLINTIRNTKDWYDFYSNINNRKTAWFIENKLKLSIVEFEPGGSGKKKVDLKAYLLNNQGLYIEVKSPMEIVESKRKGGSFNYSLKIQRCFERASEQFLDHQANFLILTNDTSPPLQNDLLAQNHIYELFSNFSKISAVGILGNIYIGEMYRFEWAVNENAGFLIDPSIFKGFSKIYKL